MLKVFGKSILNGVFDKKVFKIPKYQILNLQYFKYQIQKVFQILPTSGNYD